MDTHGEIQPLEHAHVEPVSVYIGIFAALIVLTVVTTGVAFLDLGRLNTIVALVIAVSKAVLVVLFFMHVRHSSRLMKVVVGAGIFWLVILIGLTMGDFISRGWLGYLNK